jgi:hypothetical protein
MTDDRIGRLEDRVSKLEAGIAADIKDIREKINAMAVRNAKQECPEPGACIGLGRELSHAVTAMNSTLLRVERLELRIYELEKNKQWVMGAKWGLAVAAASCGSLITMAINYFLK